VIQLDAWGAALQYFTGSQAHNIAVRQIAIRNKLKLSEYGLFDSGTGELIVSRTEEEVYARLFRACARTGTALEINASPQRLDLPSDHIRAARDAGVVFAIHSDAHSVADQGNLPYGVGTARRGWLTPDDVINNWPLDRLRAFLRKGRT
jgi:histidinol phosphatase-like PHP family hydrolase